MGDGGWSQVSNILVISALTPRMPVQPAGKWAKLNHLAGHGADRAVVSLSTSSQPVVLCKTRLSVEGFAL